MQLLAYAESALPFEMALYPYLLFSLVVLPSLCIRAARHHELAPTNISNCADDSALFKLHSITMMPDPPRKNAHLNVHISGELTGNICDGTLHVSVRFGALPLLSKVFELCSFLRQYESYALPQCPLRLGRIVYEKSFWIPRQIPTGLYTMEAEAKTNRGAPIFCLQTKLKLARRRFSSKEMDKPMLSTGLLYQLEGLLVP